MKIRELSNISPQSFIFIRNQNGTVTGYIGQKRLWTREIATIKATSYPMYKSVLEVTLKPLCITNEEKGELL